MYELIAIDAQGRRSIPTVVEPPAFFNAFELLFRPLLTGINNIVNYSPFRFGFTCIESVLTGKTPLGIPLISSEVIETDAQIITRTGYDCVPVNLVVVTIGIPVGDTVFQFVNCEFRGIVLNGIVSVSIDGETGTYFENDPLDEFQSDIDFVST